jgi:hypothetical protein
MRRHALVLVVALVAAGAHANTIEFGVPTDLTTCTLGGNVAERSCTHAATVDNGVLDGNASLAIVGQASADNGPSADPTAVADMTISYSIPYTVTRTWSTVPGVQPLLVIPTQSLNLSLDLSGEVALDSALVGGGAGLEVPDFTVTSARLGEQILGADIALGPILGGGLRRTPFSDHEALASILGRKADGSAGEIGLVIELPTDYRDWTDFVDPTLAPTYDWQTQAYSGTQTFTDTLTVTFRLRAASRPSGSVSANAGEAIACAGQTSPLASFALDDGGTCGSGFTVQGMVQSFGSTSGIFAPESTTILLLGSGLVGLAAFRTRRPKRHK